MLLKINFGYLSAVVLAVVLLAGKTAHCEATPHHSQTFMPLLDAIARGKVSEVHRLLDHGANPNEVGTFYNDGLASAAPFVYAVGVLTACDGDDMRRAHVLAICKDLLRHGAKIDQRGTGRQTPLMVSAQLPDTDVLLYLLDHGAQINARDGARETPLMYAVENRAISGGSPNIPNAQAVAVLLRRGALVNLQDEHGETALMKLGQYFKSDPSHSLADHLATAVAHTLLVHGANPWLQTGKGETALHFAKANAMPQLSALLEQVMSRPKQH